MCRKEGRGGVCTFGDHLILFEKVAEKWDVIGDVEIRNSVKRPEIAIVSEEALQQMDIHRNCRAIR
jgi:hypothetical protein